MRVGGIVALIAWCLPPGAFACTCVVDDSPLAEQVETAVQNSDVVAEVEIVSTSVVEISREVSGQKWSWTDRQYHDHVQVLDERKLVAQINVLRTWKSPDHSFVAVRTAAEWQACGLGFEVGQRLLLYARSQQDKEEMESDSCTRTKPIDAAEEEIRILNRMRTEEPSNTDGRRIHSRNGSTSR